TRLLLLRGPGRGKYVHERARAAGNAGARLRAAGRNQERHRDRAAAGVGRARLAGGRPPGADRGAAADPLPGPRWRIQERAVGAATYCPGPLAGEGRGSVWGGRVSPTVVFRSM